MGSLLAALTTIVVTALAAALAAPYILDWNDYKSVFEQQAAKLIGRPVRIEGDVALTILPIPEIRLKGVRVADPAGGFDRPFAEAENFTMVLALPPLLSGTIEARKVELDQPILRFTVGANGEGNWKRLGPDLSGLSIPAREVILQNLTISDGAVEYRGAPDATPARIDQISGSFSADSLAGPFRFNGTGALGRDRRDLKLTLSHSPRPGMMRLKASMGSASGASHYQLDGDLKTDGVVQYVGPVVAKLALGIPVGGKGDRADVPPRARSIELRAASTITLDDARLQDIALTVTEDDRPQSFTGSAYASWSGAPRLDLTVQSSLLDIDHLAGAATTRTNPLAALGALPLIFEGWAFEPKQGAIKAQIQQANLGGDIIEGINFSATHARGTWRVERLEARLPGDSPLSIRGSLTQGERIAFEGDFDLSGRHLSRLLRWAAPSLGAVDTGDSQHFSLKSGLSLSGQRVAFRGGAGELGDSRFSGDLSYDYGDASQLALTLASERLDLRSVFGGRHFGFGAETPSADDAPTPQAEKTTLVDAAATLFKARTSQVSLRIAQLQLPDFEARDVRAALRYVDGTLDISELNLATTEGLSIKADGLFTEFDTSPNGAVNLAVNAPSAPSLANLAKLFGLESFGAAARRRMDALAPLRLTAKLNGSKHDRLLNLTLAGSAAGSELTLNGRFDGEFAALNQARIDLNGTIANADGRRLIAQLAPEMPLSAEPVRGGAGVVKVSALGALQSGLISKIELRTPEAEGRFEGQITPLEEPWGFNGDLWLRAGQASTALSMLRLSPGGSPVSGTLDLRASISKDKATYQVANVSLQIGGETISGTASINAAGKRPAATIEAKASSVMLPKLAAYLVDWDRKDLSATASDIVSGGANIWPNQSFSFRAFEALDGTLRITTPSLSLIDGLTLANAQLGASLKDAALTIDTLKGQLYGGTFTASGTLAAGEGKAELKGRLRLDKADLARLTAAPDGKPLARGTGEFRLTLSGEGFSPRGLMTVLSGKGRVRMSRGTLVGLAPAVLGQAADTYLTEEIPQQTRLVQRITRDLRQPQASIPYRGFIAPVILKDGVLAIRNAGFKSPDYLATAGLLVDLATLRLDSSWSLAFRGKTRVANQLPPVRLVFAGPVNGFTTLQPALQTEEFERTLSMRRMDRDMDKLERLNRQPASVQPSVQGAPREVPGARTPLPSAPATAPAAALGGSVPSPSARSGPTSPASVAPAPPTTGWSAGVEETTRPPARPNSTADGPAAAPLQPPQAFEDQIRKILEQEQKPASPQAGSQPVPPQTSSPSRDGAFPRPEAGSSLSYQTETYAQSTTEPDQTEATAAPPIVAPRADPAVPIPERRGTPPRRASAPRQPQSLWDLFQ